MAEAAADDIFSDIFSLDMPSAAESRGSLHAPAQTAVLAARAASLGVPTTGFEQQVRANFRLLGARPPESALSCARPFRSFVLCPFRRLRPAASWTLSKLWFEPWPPDKGVAELSHRLAVVKSEADTAKVETVLGNLLLRPQPQPQLTPVCCLCSRRSQLMCTSSNPSSSTSKAAAT